MTMSRLILALGLTLPTAVLSGQVRCLPAAGTDPGLAQAFCAVLRDQAPDGDMDVHVLATGPGLLSVRLDRPGLPGQPLDLSVTDRALTPAMLAEFARDVLLFSLDLTTGNFRHV